MRKRRPIKYPSVKSVRLSSADKKLVRELTVHLSSTPYFRDRKLDFSDLVREGFRALAQREGIKAA